MSEAIAEVSAAEQTPLDTVLGSDAADVPVSSQEADSHVDTDGPQVPLVALRRERERRQKMDARVQELEQEIERYNDQKFGLDSDQGFGGEQPAEQQPDDAFGREYTASLTDFTAKHGKDRVAAIDATLGRLNPQQYEALGHELQRINPSPKDLADTATTILVQAGLLDPAFKPLSIGDVLAGEQPEKAVDTSQIDQRLAALDQREKAMAAAEGRTKFIASRSEFVSEHGRAKFNELDAASMQLVQSGHPVAAQYAEAIKTSPDPVGTAAQLLSEWGLWSPGQPQQPQPVFPTNIAAARNVGGRKGPAWTGPTPIGDIFDRTRPDA